MATSVEVIAAGAALVEILPNGVTEVVQVMAERGATGPEGPTGPAGPNTVTSATTTDLTGVLMGNGTAVSAVSAISATELGYLDGVTSALQGQIDAKLASATAASTYAPIAHNQAWSTITSTPTTLAGYGISDAITAATAASTYLPLVGGTITGSAAASTPALSFTGNVFTDGTGTTTKPLVLIEPTGTASTAWSTKGTFLGVNAGASFDGNLIDLQVAATSKFKVTYSGAATFAAGVTATTGTLSTGLTIGTTDQIYADSSSLRIGTATRTIYGGAIVLTKNRTEASNGHGFDDNSTINPSDAGRAYASFDARGLLTGTQNMNHYVGFQFDPVKSGVGTLDFMGAYTSSPTISAGTLSLLRHISIADVTVSGSGAVTTQIGLYVSGFVAATTNWAVYTAAPTSSYFGGSVAIGTDGSAAPTHTLQVQGGIRSGSTADNNVLLGANFANGFGGIYILGDTSSYGVSYSEIQSLKEGTGFWPIVMQRRGGNVLIGGTTDSGVKLQVTGSITSTATVTGLNVTASSTVQGGNVFASSICGANSNSGALFIGASADVLLYRDAANILAQRNSTNAQTLRVYGTYTDASNYVRAAISCSTTAMTIATEHLGTGVGDGNKSIYLMPSGNSGNVGIGTTTPSHKLTVTGGTNYTGILINNLLGSVGSRSALSFGLHDGTFQTESSGRIEVNCPGNPNAQMLFQVYGGGLATVLTLHGSGTATFAGGITATTATFSGQILAASGTNTAPGIAFSARSAQGFCRFNNDAIGYGNNNTAMVFNAANRSITVAFDGFYGFSSSTPDLAGSDTQILRDGSGIIAQRSSTFAQTFRVYGSYTDASTYSRASLSCSTTALTLAFESNTGNGDVVLTPKGTGIISTAASFTSLGTVTGASGSFSGGNVNIGVGSAQIEFKVNTTGVFYFGNFNTPGGSKVGFSVPGNVIQAFDQSTLRCGIGGTGGHYTSTSPTSLLEVRGKADEVQLNIRNFSTQTSNPFQVLSNADVVLASVSPTGGITATTGTFSAGIYLGTGGLLTASGNDYLFPAHADAAFGVWCRSPGGASVRVHGMDADPGVGSFLTLKYNSVNRLFVGDNVTEQRNSTNAQTLRVYGSYTDASTYSRASLSCSTTALTLAFESNAGNGDVILTPKGTGVVSCTGVLTGVDTTVSTPGICLGSTNFGIGGSTNSVLSLIANGYSKVRLLSAANNDRIELRDTRIIANSSSADLGISIESHGTGSVAFFTNANSGNLLQAQVTHTASAVNYLSLTGAITTASPVISVAGSDTNIDLTLTPKGTGNVRYGTHSAIAAETVTGYITIKDSGGTTRKLAVVS